MASKWANIVAETTTTGGTGALTLLGAIPGAIGAFSSLGDGWTGQITIIEVDASGAPTGGGTETSTGTYHSGSNTITRGAVESSTNGGALVNFANGTTKRVQVELTAAQIAAFGFALYDGANSISSGTAQFANANGVTFSINGQTVSASVNTNYLTAQSNQTLGFYAESNTTLTSSGTFDARSMSVQAMGSLSVGFSASSLVFSAPNALTTAMQSNAATISNVNISASQSSANVSAVTFSNANGVTFGYDKTNITASVNTSYLGSNASTNYVQANAAFNGTNASGTIASNNISVSVAAQSAQSAIQALGVSNTGNSAGNTGVSTGINFVLAGSNNITMSQSTTAGGPNTIWASGPTLTQYLTTAMQSNAATISNINVSAGGSSANVSAVTFSNANGVTFGYDKTNITASVAAQSNQSAIQALGVSNTGNTAGNTGVSTGINFAIAGSNNITASQSTSAGGPNTIWLSGPTLTQYLTTADLSQNSSNYVSAWSLAGAHTAGTTTTAIGTDLYLSGGNNVTLSGNSNTIVFSAANQTTQSAIKGFGASNTGNTAGNTGISTGVDWVLAGTNNITVSESTVGGGPNTLWLSAPNAGQVNFSAGTTSSGLNSVVFSNSNNVSFGLNGSTITATYALNVSAAGGTSNALSAITFTNSNGVTFGLSTGAGVGTMTASVAAQSNQTLSAVVSSNTTGNTSGMTFDARSVSFQGYGAASVGLSTTNTGSSILFSVPVQTNQSMGFYATGNTTSSASSTTYDARSVSFSGAGAISVGMSGASGIVVSSPVTSSLVGFNNITVSTNGSTINVGNIPLSVYEPFPVLTGTAYSSHAPASWWFNRVVLPDVLALSNINVAKSMSVALPVVALASSGTQKYSYSHGVTVFSRQNYGAQSSNLSTFTTASFGMTASISVTVSSISAALSWVTNSTGGTTSVSTAYNGASSASWSVYFSGPFNVQIPCVTTLTGGEYFVAHAHSSTAATGGNAIFALSTNLLSVSNLHIAPQVAGPLQTLGQSVTQASLNPWGMGAGIASAVTTNNSMAGSVVSGQTQNNWYMGLSNA